jgi:hypothetical protein
VQLSLFIRRGATPYLLETPVEGLMIAGRFKANQAVQFQDVVLPEFSRSKKIDSFIAYVIDSNSQYDLILGRDFLLKAGIDTCFLSTKMTDWLGQRLKMKPPGFWEDPLNLYIFLHLDEDELEEEHVTEIKESKYEKVDPIEVAQ